MNYRRFDFKVAFLESIFREYEGKPVRVMDLGSGTSKDFVEVLRHHPNVQYTGVEFNEGSIAVARQSIGDLPNVSLVHGFGEEIRTRFADTFDLTLSLSVLEHVKHLRSFLVSSVEVTRTGGRIVHRYDLGHAYHSSRYERLKVFCCRRFPVLVPARHFTGKPDRGEIVRILEAAGVRIREVRHSQTPSLKAAVNRLRWDEGETEGLARRILDLDERLSSYLAPALSEREIEYFFPSVTIDGIKAGA